MIEVTLIMITICIMYLLADACAFARVDYGIFLRNFICVEYDITWFLFQFSELKVA